MSDFSTDLKIRLVGKTLRKRARNFETVLFNVTFPLIIPHMTSSEFEPVFDFISTERQKSSCLQRNGHWYTSLFEGEISNKLIGGMGRDFITEEFLKKRIADLSAQSEYSDYIEFKKNMNKNEITDPSYDKINHLLSSMIFIDGILYKKCNEPILIWKYLDEKKEIKPIVQFSDYLNNDFYLKFSEERVLKQLYSFSELLLSSDKNNKFITDYFNIKNKNYFNFKFDDIKLYNSFIQRHYAFFFKEIMTEKNFRSLSKKTITSFFKTYSPTSEVESINPDDINNMLDEMEFGIPEIYKKLPPYLKKTFSTLRQSTTWYRSVLSEIQNETELMIIR